MIHLIADRLFRWEKIDKKTYSGAFLNNKLTISEEPENGVFRLHDTTVQNFENIWIDYFDLNTDYGSLNAASLKTKLCQKPAHLQAA